MEQTCTTGAWPSGWTSCEATDFWQAAHFSAGAASPDADPLELERARAEERRRMGRELHDSTAQLLVALQLQVGRLKSTLGDDRETVPLADVERTIGALHSEIRSVALLSNPPDLERFGLIGALAELARRFALISGLAVTFEAPRRATACDERTSFAAYRVAQEALANVHRHAEARAARIVIRFRREELDLSVRDDGKGIRHDALATGNGLGLANIRQRTEALGGAMALQRMRPGTCLRVRLPLASARERTVESPAASHLARAVAA